MCGIVGILDTRGLAQIDRVILGRMNATQAHRGPDGEGIHIEPGLALGHRRLSIIDLAGGRQPMYNEDGSVVIVYNGEIYNFVALRRALASHGHVFKTNCDTEVIVHGWEEWGEDCVKQFRGMFAFAIWDRKKRMLFLARDRLGIKPLYYAFLPDGHFIFGSELKALLVHPDLPREIDPQAVEDYFAYGYIPEPKSIFRSVRKLPPGHIISVKYGQSTCASRQYWDVPFRSVGLITAREAQEELIHRLREAVRMRLVSEVPLGAFLSGGVDSSAIVAMMASVANGPVNTCSISFADPRYNEAHYAAQVARRYGTNHYVEQVEPDDFDLIDKLVSAYDEPYADSSAIPTYRVCELARKRVTVALSGDGGDENFAGYRRYRWHLYEERIRSLFPESIRRPVFGFLGNTYPKLDWAPQIVRAKSTLQAIAKDSLEGYFHGVCITPDALRGDLFSDGFRRELQGYRAIEVLRTHAAQSPTSHPLSLVQYLDLKTYLPGDILTKVDRASMAHSLEVRVSLLDHELVEWVSGLPPEFKMKGLQTKIILKKALEPLLPREILYRRKMGFSVPLARWCRIQLRQRIEQVISGRFIQSTGIFNERFLKRLADQHSWGIHDYGSILWALLIFEASCTKLLTTRQPDRKQSAGELYAATGFKGVS